MPRGVKTSPEKVNEAIALRRAGRTFGEIAAATGLDYRTVWNLVRHTAVEPPAVEPPVAMPDDWERKPLAGLPDAGLLEVPVVGGTPEAIVAAGGHLFAIKKESRGWPVLDEIRNRRARSDRRAAFLREAIALEDDPEETTALERFALRADSVQHSPLEHEYLTYAAWVSRKGLYESPVSG